MHFICIALNCCSIIFYSIEPPPLNSRSRPETLREHAVVCPRVLLRWSHDLVLRKAGRDLACLSSGRPPGSAGDRVASLLAQRSGRPPDFGQSVCAQSRFFRSSFSVAGGTSVTSPRCCTIRNSQAGSSLASGLNFRTTTEPSRSRDSRPIRSRGSGCTRIRPG